MSGLDAVVVGAGPNGLAAAITLAQAGLRVRVLEAHDTPGGGCRSAELTLPGFVHDVCSAIHPSAVASPFFRGLGLDVEFVQPDAPLAHLLEDGNVVMLERSVEATAAQFGQDARAWRRLFARPVARADAIVSDFLGPVLRIPRHPVTFTRFGLRAVQSAAMLASRFRDPSASALFAGVGAHSMLPLDRLVTGGVALLLGTLGHAFGWPLARGGSQSITDALVSKLAELGGEVECGVRVASLDELPSGPLKFLDVTPRALVEIAGDRLPPRRRDRLRRFRYGPGVFKVDWALSGPVPWTSPEVARAGTVHVGGTFAEISIGEYEVSRGTHPLQPFVILAQQSLFDASRAPQGNHTLWGYCHVPSGSDVDMTDRIESQIERFAPGFRDLVLARSTKGPKSFEGYNANYVGGDIIGGVQDLRQTIARPFLSTVPWATGAADVWLCSSSTPPGGAVHGMCGHLAARHALKGRRT